jgi:hypothetical protein
MPYKGPQRVGSTVEAKLLLDHTATGPAFLLVGYGRRGGSPSGEGDTVAPGGSAQASMELDARGRLELGVDMSDEFDTGVLVISVDGKETHRENIRGDTIWAYAVLARPGGQP